MRVFLSSMISTFSIDNILHTADWIDADLFSSRPPTGVCSSILGGELVRSSTPPESQILHIDASLQSTTTYI